MAKTYHRKLIIVLSMLRLYIAISDVISIVENNLDPDHNNLDLNLDLNTCPRGTWYIDALCIRWLKDWRHLGINSTNFAMSFHCTGYVSYVRINCYNKLLLASIQLSSSPNFCCFSRYFFKVYVNTLISIS